MCIVCTVVWPKGTSLDEVMSNSERIKPIALAIIELRFSESISQSVGRSVGQSVSSLGKPSLLPI